MQNRGNGHSGISMADRKREVYSGGIETDIQDGHFAKSFITASEDIAAAWSLTTFRDEKQRNACVKLYHKLLKYHVTHGLIVLKALMDSNPSVGGYNRAIAAQVGTGIIDAEALGVNLSRSAKKALNKASEERRAAQNNQSNQNNNSSWGGG